MDVDQRKPNSSAPEDKEEIRKGILDGVQYTAEDFLSGTRPYEAVYGLHNDSFQEGRMLERMASVARALGVNSFKKLYKDYVKSIRSASDTEQNNVAQFEHQEIELSTGEWMADDTGIWKYGAYGSYEVACPHAILPVERLKNIDTGELKVRLRFRRGEKGRRPWSEVTVDFDTLSNARNVVNLSKMGVSVTSGKRAQNLVDYLADVMDLNYDAIPERRSVSRMGWSDEGFSPYVADLVFDGNPGFERTFRAVSQKGAFESWRETAIQARRDSVTARIVLAASFASVLIKPLNALPFFVHLWGVDSGTGKTVAQMVGASVWGDPQVGGPLFPTFRSTSVGFEIIAGFLNNLPVFIDELQLAKDHRGRTIFNVYELAAGAGKLRANRSLGLSAAPTWANCFITSGESAIVGDHDGAGAANRVIEIECRADEKVIQDGRAISASVREHFGHAGKIFISHLLQPGTMDEVRKVYESFYTDCLKKNATEKQALAAAMLVTADWFATQWIFKDDLALLVDDLGEFLKTNEQVSAGVRGYDYLCGWVAQNASKFIKPGEGGTPMETFGVINEEGYAYIISTVFNKACEDVGLSPKAIKSYLRSHELILTRDKNLTRGKRINNVNVPCVAMKLPGRKNGFIQLDDDEADEMPL